MTPHIAPPPGQDYASARAALEALFSGAEFLLCATAAPCTMHTLQPGPCFVRYHCQRRIVVALIPQPEPSHVHNSR